MASNNKKCFCTAPLSPNGTCQYGCDPALRAPGRRAVSTDAKIKDRERRSYRLGFTKNDIANGAAKVIPIRISEPMAAMGRRAAAGRWRR